MFFAWATITMEDNTANCRIARMVKYFWYISAQAFDL